MTNATATKTATPVEHAIRAKRYVHLTIRFGRFDRNKRSHVSYGDTLRTFALEHTSRLYRVCDAEGNVLLENGEPVWIRVGDYDRVTLQTVEFTPKSRKLIKTRTANRRAQRRATRKASTTPAPKATKKKDRKMTTKTTTVAARSINAACPTCGAKGSARCVVDGREINRIHKPRVRGTKTVRGLILSSIERVQIRQDRVVVKGRTEAEVKKALKADGWKQQGRIFVKAVGKLFANVWVDGNAILPCA